MIAVEKVRELVIEPLGDNRPAYVTSASGLVRLDNRVYIVADDELHLAVFDLRSSEPGSWIKLLPGMLPSDYKERKKQKSGLETITRLKPDVYAADGALLKFREYDLGDIERMVRIEGRDKFEGICADYLGIEISPGTVSHSLEILLVSDTDNENFPSNLYRGTVRLN